MKILMMALSALMISGMSHAAIDALWVKFAPTASVYAVGDRVFATANTNLEGAEYRFLLEQLEGGQYVSVNDSGWGGRRDFDLHLAIYLNAKKPGKYRLQAYAREGAGLPEVMTSKPFRVIGRADPDYARIHQMNAIRLNFEKAAFVIRNELVRVRKKLAYVVNADREFSEFQEGQYVIDEFLGRWIGYSGCCDEGLAPGGGPSVIAGEPGDGDATGAVVINVLSPPADPDDWGGTTVTVTLPAYPAVNDLTRRTETIRWED